jgi:hypothetical protein
MGTIHAQNRIAPNGKYMNLKEYQQSYKFALENTQLLPQPIGRTRAQTKTALFTKEELAKINEESNKVNDQISSLSLDKWNEKEELAKAGLKPIMKTNEDTDEEVERLLFAEF